MSDITANVVVSMPSQLFTLARSFKAAANGRIYIGQIDTDPTIPSNQIQVYVEGEDEPLIPVAQPVIINAGGYPVYNGQISKFVTVQGHSMAVYDAYGAQQFYFPNILRYNPDQLRADLLVEGGPFLVDDSRVEVLQPDTGVARSQHSKNRDAISIKDFSDAQPAGNDWTSVFQKAIDDTALKGNGTLFIPDGRYGISGLTLKSGVSLIGSSKEACIIFPTAQDKTIFKDDGNSESHGMILTIANISIDCGAVTGTTGVRCLAGNRINIEHVNFFGCKTNIEFDQGGNHLIANVLSAPSSGVDKAGQLKLWSSDDAKYGAVFTTVTNYRVEGDSVDPAIFMRRAVGLKFSNLVINDNSYDGTGIIIENDCQGIMFNGGIIVGAGKGVVFQKGDGIDKSPIVNIFQDVDFDQCQENSILFNAGTGNQISGGVITSSDIGTTTTAMAFVGQDAQRNRIDGVSIGGYYGDGGIGVLISNSPNNKFTNITVEGTKTGFAFVSDVRGTIIEGGDVRYNVTNKTTGAYQQAGVSIAGLQGFSGSPGVVTPTIAATGVAVTNAFGVPVRIFIKGGSVSKIQINGLDMAFSANASITIYPSETIAVFYTGGTDWSWIGI